MDKDATVIGEARKRFHSEIMESGVLVVDDSGVASNSDKDNTPSKEIGALIAKALNAKKGVKLPAQSSGKAFEGAVARFLESTFPRLQHLRPGEWSVHNLGNNNSLKTSGFVQYEHLSHLAKVLDSDRQLATMIGLDYIVAPDIVVSRLPCDDETINSGSVFVDGTVGLKSDLRKKNNPLELMHASVSVKWTIRSDRAQNSRTEAKNLISHRKGRVPHIVVVTGEPLPSRLSSLALGTGDIDCVYHFALYELMDAVRRYGKSGREDIVEQLESMIVGKRLKDISDLPLDLAC